MYFLILKSFACTCIQVIYLENKRQLFLNIIQLFVVCQSYLDKTKFGTNLSCRKDKSLVHKSPLKANKKNEIKGVRI